MMHIKKEAAAYTRLASPKQGGALFLLCFAAYAAAYIGRYNYSALMGAVTADGALTLEAAGAVSTGYFICYAAGQIISGALCRVFSPFALIFTGLCLSGACNIGMGTAASCSALMPLLWAANGLFQAMIWPPIVRIFAECMPHSQQKGACVNINSTTPVGTLIAYGLCAALLAVSTWRTAFCACGAVLIIMAVIWALGTAPIRKACAPQKVISEADSAASIGTKAAQTPKIKGGIIAALAACGLMPLILPVMLHGGLKDGVTSWVPTMIQANFAVSPAFSAAISMVLPLVNLLGAYAAGFLDARVLHSEVKTAAALFVPAAISLALLPLAVRYSVWLTVVLLAVTTASMLGINTMFVNVMPVRASSALKKGGAAVLSGALNAVTYAGAALAAWGIGAAAGAFSWGAVFALWVIMAVLSLSITLLCVKPWSSFTAKNKEDIS